MLSCNNIKCPHHRVRKDIDYSAMAGRTAFNFGRMKLVSYGECKYSYCRIRKGTVMKK